MKKYDVIIVGGGASGLMCALQFENSNKKVLVLDAGLSLGKKILVTGNGRCNLTNENMSSNYFNCDISKHLKQFNQNDAIKFFNSIGLIVYSDNEGRVYPVTNSAKSVVDVIVKRVKKLSNIDIISNYVVKNIAIKNCEYIINENEFKTSNLIIASGNIKNEFLTNFDIKKTKSTPSLVALKTKENTKNLEGVKISGVMATAECLGETKSEVGEVLFKDNGLSGIVIFNLSTLFARNKCFEGSVVLDLLPKRKESEVVTIIKDRCNMFDNVVDIFMGLFVDPVREEIFRRAKINEQLKSNKLTKSKMEEIAYIIKNMHFTINNFYNNNQVISGGIDINELSSTLESKKYKGLYFIGEVVDVDGECGGYNLQWAWTSGAIVGKCLK